MANGDKKKGIKAKDRFVSKKGTPAKTGKKTVYKTTSTKKEVPKAKVTIGKPKKAVKYNIVVKSGGKTRNLGTRLATGSQAKKLVAAGKKKKK